MTQEWLITAIMVAIAFLAVIHGDSGRTTVRSRKPSALDRVDRNDTRARADAIIAYLTAHP